MFRHKLSINIIMLPQDAPVRKEPHCAGLPESKLKQILEGISTSK